MRAPTLNPTTATLEWAQPECEKQNGIITEYDWELEPLDKWDTRSKIDGTSRQEYAQVKDLLPYTKCVKSVIFLFYTHIYRYRARVRAENSKGTGPWSDWLEIRTRPGPPGAPRDLKLDEIQPTAVKLSWLPPEPPNGELDEYKIRYK